MAEIIDTVIPRRADAAATVGTYIMLATANRVVEPCSKVALADWWTTTAGPRWLKIPATALDHRRFWEAMDTLGEAELAAIETQIGQRVIAEYMVLSVTPRNVKILDQFRTEALERSIPAADVDRWLALVRPCARLETGTDGPVVGRFGGPVMLPAEAEDPRFPLIVTLDCAALPTGVTDLPLPSDGHLLLFGFPDNECNSDSMGDVVHVPAGTTVEERATPPTFDLPPDYSKVCEELPQGELRLTADISLPFVGEIEVQEPPGLVPLPGHPYSEELAEVWGDQWGGASLVVGGYGTDFNGGDSLEVAASFAGDAERAGKRPGPGKTSPNAADWVLLAECNVSRPGGGAAIFWAIQRDDLIAQRFDRAHAVVDWNP